MHLGKIHPLPKASPFGRKILEPKEDESILSVLTNAIGRKSRFGSIRLYDIIFTENGIAFIETINALRMGAWRSYQKNYAEAQKKREQRRGMTVREILRHNNGFFLSYMEVNRVTVKRGMFLDKVIIQLTDRKVLFEIPKEQYVTASAIISQKLAGQMTE